MGRLRLTQVMSPTLRVGEGSRSGLVVACGMPWATWSVWRAVGGTWRVTSRWAVLGEWMHGS